LVSPAIAAKIAAATDVRGGELVVEIGSGTGALTKHLLALPAAKIIAVELDRRAAEHLRSTFGHHSALEIVEGNVLTLQLGDLGFDTRAPGIAVGNIPYHLTGPILFWLYEQASHLRRIVLMVQKEVAARIVARPGTKAYGILSVATALVATRAQILFDVHPGAFFPPPQVTSSVVAIDCKGTSLAHPSHAWTMALTKAAFNQRRKKLRNALARFLEEHCGDRSPQVLARPEMDCRAEELSPAQLEALALEVQRIRLSA
jgi:16S rRNA (adenine1518-N6/adenine1519-N6)-dimethyltransferase